MCTHVCVQRSMRVSRVACAASARPARPAHKYIVQVHAYNMYIYAPPRKPLRSLPRARRPQGGASRRDVADRGVRGDKGWLLLPRPGGEGARAFFGSHVPQATPQRYYKGGYEGLEDSDGNGVQSEHRAQIYLLVGLFIFGYRVQPRLGTDHGELQCIASLTSPPYCAITHQPLP